MDAKYLFDKILSIPFKDLANIGEYRESPDLCESLKGINYHGLIINININYKYDSLCIHLENDQGCCLELAELATPTIIEDFDNYLVNRENYCRETILNEFNLCKDKWK